jgi:chemotaxis protein MotB
MADKKEDSGGKRPIIVIKKIKKVAGGHHGGAWKVAYADFVTAMMAFFLLLWLLNVTTKEQKAGIADYFKPSMASTAESGSGGVMGGMSMTTEGAKTTDPKETATTENSPSDVEEETKDPGEEKNAPPANPTQNQFEKMKADEEQKQFENAMKDIKQAIQDDAQLKELAKNLIVDMTPEGLRIQIVDQQGRSMFPSGSAQMYDATQQLISKVALIVNKLPQKISIRGHTDSVPYGNNATYDNWNLSADRANASRQALMKAGFPANRISNVAGKADTEALFPKDPASPQNRRISIILMRDHPDGAVPAKAN